MRIIFMGTPAFAVKPLQRLIDSPHEVVLCVSQPDKPQGRHKEVIPTPVKALALAEGIDVLQPTKVRTEEFANQLAAYAPDLIVTAAFGRILPSNILTLPKYGAINIHGSILPAYRGASPVQASLINGDSETGVTILEMTEAMDAGAILAMAKLKIRDEHNITTLMADLANLGAEIIVPTVDAIGAGSIIKTPQDETKATYVKMLDRDSGYIDFRKEAREIFNLVRGTNPWPTAYTGFNGKRFKIHRAKVLNPAMAEEFYPDFKVVNQDLLTSKTYGQRLQSPKNQLWILCGPGHNEFADTDTNQYTILAIEVFQMEGGKQLKSLDAAHNLPKDMVLGS